MPSTPVRERLTLRAALDGLTLRGRCLVAAGLGVGLCGAVLAQQDLLRIAVLLLALPALAVVAARWGRVGLTTTRVPSPARVVVGQTCRVRLDVRNPSRRPTPLLKASERVSGVAAPPPRFALEPMRPQGRAALAYSLRFTSRGRHVVGPLAVRLGDPLGLCEIPAAVGASTVVTVVPAVEALPGLGPLGAARGEAGPVDGGDRSAAASGEAGMGTREYRPGDDLRRVHWRSTARYGELMVRLDEHVRTRRASVLLDVRASAHRGRGPSSSFEQAVSVAASVAAALLAGGFTVSLRTSDAAAASPATGWVHGGGGLDVLLDSLVDVAPVNEHEAPTDRTAQTHRATHHRAHEGRHLAEAAAVLTAVGGPSVVVAVLGRLQAADAAALAGVPTANRVAVAVLVEPAAATASADLSRAGWSVLALRRGESLAQAWAGAAAVDALGGVA